MKTKTITKLRAARDLIHDCKSKQFINNKEKIDFAHQLIDECEIESNNYLFCHSECEEQDKIKFLCWIKGDRPTQTNPAHIYVWDEGHISTSEFGDYYQDDVQKMVIELTEALEIA